MSQIEVVYAKKADKFFKQHENVRKTFKENIKKRIERDHPESVDVQRLQGKQEDYYRMRIGAYRVIYTVTDGEVVVVCALLAGSRGDIYKDIGGLK